MTLKFLSNLTLCELSNFNTSATSFSLLFFVFLKLWTKKSLFILNPNLSSLPMQLMIKKLFIILFIIITFVPYHSKVLTENLSFDDFGVISVMYHRFDEAKYPSTNIQLNIFKQQLEIIEKAGIKFVHPINFKQSLSERKG